MNKISVEDEIVLLSLQLSPGDKELSRLNDCLLQVEHWDEFASSLADRGIGQLLYHKLGRLSNSRMLPPKATEKLKQSYYLTLSRNMRLQEAFSQIAQQCDGLGIQLVPLKGIYLSTSLYQDSGLRLLSDIDILVNKEQAPRVLEAIKKLGYTASETDDFVGKHREVVHYEPMVKNGVAVELHIKLHRSIESYTLNETDVLNRAVYEPSNHYYVPDKIDHLIFISLHLDRHFRQGAIQLSGYCDVLNLCGQLSDTDWDILQERCNDWNCVTEFYTHIMLLYLFTSVKLPAYITERYKHLPFKADQNLFLEYIRGNRHFISGVPNHLSSLKLLPFLKKIRFIFNIVFPSKDFMIQKYNLVGSRLLAESSKQKAVSRKQQAVSSKQQTEFATRNPKPETRNSELKTQNSELKIPDSELPTQNSRLKTQNSKLKFWFLWYPYRWWVGVKGVFKLIVNSITNWIYQSKKNK